MIEGKRMTLGEFTKREAIRMKERAAAEAADPEVQARKKDHEEHERRMVEAERRWAKENASTPFEDGKEAANLALPREAPEELDDDAADQWIDGYDSLGSGEDE